MNVSSGSIGTVGVVRKSAEHKWKDDYIAMMAFVLVCAIAEGYLPNPDGPIKDFFGVD